MFALMTKLISTKRETVIVVRKFVGHTFPFQ